MKRIGLILINALWVISCTQSFQGGPVLIQAIRSVGHCAYSTDLVQIDSLNSLQPIAGSLGKFVQTRKKFEKEDDYYSPDFQLVGTRFQNSNGGYYPRDYASLVGSSVYFYFEQTQKLFASVDARADLMQVVPNLRDTLIYYKATVQEGTSLSAMTDNAAYFKPSPVGGIDTRNFLFTFPNQEITDVPLSLNPGVISHEVTHFISQYLWRNSLNSTSISDYGLKVIDSLDEGLSDYAGFIYSQDPGFFSCSFPMEDRDLSSPKRFSGISPSLYSSSYDIHAGGAVWAAVQFQIGQLLSANGQNGHLENLRTLVQLFGSLASCPGTNNLTFQSIKQCHLNLIGNSNPQIQQIYNQAYDLGGNF